MVTSAPTVGNDLVVARAAHWGECIPVMFFWVVAVLGVLLVLAIVWGLYVLVRHWL